MFQASWGPAVPSETQVDVETDDCRLVWGWTTTCLALDSFHQKISDLGAARQTSVWACGLVSQSEGSLFPQGLCLPAVCARHCSQLWVVAREQAQGSQIRDGGK